MNDLHKEEELSREEYFTPEEIPPGIDKPTTRQLYYKKLGAYLLLLYQSYLKRETILESEVKMALWRMIKFDQEFRARIQLLQLDYLNKEAINLEGDWDEVKDILFPINEAAQEVPKIERKKTIQEYKEIIAELLATNP